jgi:hypothetical protein
MPVSPTPAGLTVFLSCRHGSHLAIEPAKMVSMQEATEKSLQELHHQVNELKKQTPQSNQNSRPGTFQCYSCGGRGHIARHCKK